MGEGHTELGSPATSVPSTLRIVRKVQFIWQEIYKHQGITTMEEAVSYLELNEVQDIHVHTDKGSYSLAEYMHNRNLSTPSHLEDPACELPPTIAANSKANDYLLSATSQLPVPVLTSIHTSNFDDHSDHAANDDIDNTLLKMHLKPAEPTTDEATEP